MAHGATRRADRRARADRAAAARRRGGGSRWRNGTQPERRARFTAVRVTPAHDWRHGRLAPEIWLLCEEETRAHTPPQVLLRQPAGVGVVASAGPLDPSALGDRAAVSRTQKRARARSLRRPHVARLATSRRPDGRRARLHPTRADAPRCGRTDVSSRARHRAGNLHRAACLRPNRATCIGWNRRNANFNYGSDKVELKPVQSDSPAPGIDVASPSGRRTPFSTRHR